MQAGGCCRVGTTAVMRWQLRLGNYERLAFYRPSAPVDENNVTQVFGVTFKDGWNGHWKV